MSTQTTIEERLTILERTVIDLQKKVGSKSDATNWLENLIGSVSDESAFLEALEHGRTFRQADRPADEVSQ